MKNEKGGLIFLTVLLAILAVLSLLLALLNPAFLLVTVGCILLIYFYCIKKLKATNETIAQDKKRKEEIYKNSYEGRKEALSKMTREEKIENNSFEPFDADITHIAEKKPYDELRYNYTDVKCNILGDVGGLREGAVLLVQPKGKLKNVVGEEVAQIENQKLSDMVNDFFVKENRFSFVACRLTKIEEGYLFCNLGFFIDITPEEDEEDEEDKED